MNLLNLEEFEYLTGILYLNPPLKINVTKGQKPLYWLLTKRGTVPKALPKKYRGKDYRFINNVLHNLPTGRKVLKNATKVGTPRKKSTNMSGIYNSGMKPYEYSKIKKELEAFFLKGFASLDRSKLTAHNRYVFVFQYHLHRRNIEDIDNTSGMFTKSFLDAAQTFKIRKKANGKGFVRLGNPLGFLSVDNVDNVLGFFPIYCPIITQEPERLVVQIYKTK